MRKIILTFLILCAFFLETLWYQGLWAETIVLKSGKTVEGKIIESNEQSVKIDFQGIPLLYSRDEIEKIEGESIAQPQPILTKAPEIINSQQYMLYIPSGIDSNKKYPLVLALSPGADAQSMISTWKNVSEKHKWLIFASKVSRNGMDFKEAGGHLSSLIRQVSLNYPADRNKIIASGFSGGGQVSHYLSMYYPNIFWAIVVNTCMIHENFSGGKSYSYPKGKIAVFLASPTDFRYNQMKIDRDFLEGLGWKTKWIEFQGGHIIASDSAYQEAAQWLSEQF